MSGQQQGFVTLGSTGKLGIVQTASVGHLASLDTPILHPSVENVGLCLMKLSPLSVVVDGNFNATAVRQNDA